MRYLLDVNTLIALGHSGHSLHSKAVNWYISVPPKPTSFLTCAITELGFVRISAATGLEPDIRSAKQTLEALKASSKAPFELIADDLGASQLPPFVNTPQLVTDGHLLELAIRSSARLVTLDRGIPDSMFIG